MASRRQAMVLAAAGALLGAATLALPRSAMAQQKRPVVGLLWQDSVVPSPHATALQDVLRDKGWMAGRDFRIEDRVADEAYGRLAERAAELVRARVDIIVTSGSTAAVAAAKATKEIPIVVHMGVDPVASGLVASLSRPGGNVTGVVQTATALNAKRIELLKELNPGLSRFGVLLTPNVGNPVYVRDAEAAARALQLTVHFSQAETPADIDGAVAELAKARVGAVYIAPSSMLTAHSVRVVEAVAKHRLPAIYGADRFMDAGGLMAYGSNARKSFVRTAGYVDRILKGARPAEMAMEQASEMELVVNLRAAKALGIKFPPSILVRADRVIE